MEAKVERVRVNYVQFDEPQLRAIQAEGRRVASQEEGVIPYWAQVAENRLAMLQSESETSRRIAANGTRWAKRLSPAEVVVLGDITGAAIAFEQNNS